MTRYLVESYVPRDGEGHGTAAARARATARRMKEEGLSVRYLRSIYVPDDETCFHLVEAASSEVVADLALRAELRFERISEVV